MRMYTFARKSQRSQFTLRLMPWVYPFLSQRPVEFYQTAPVSSLYFFRILCSYPYNPNMSISSVQLFFESTVILLVSPCVRPEDNIHTVSTYPSTGAIYRLSPHKMPTNKKFHTAMMGGCRCPLCVLSDTHHGLMLSLS